MAAPSKSGTDSLKRHWEEVYSAKEPGEVSWYQAVPAVSLSLIRASGIGPTAKIIDVGGGASTLAGHLLVEGFREITVLDLSAHAMERSREQLGTSAGRVHWIEADVLSWRAPEHYDCWHDRAVFHFLTNPQDRAAYRATLASALQPGASVIVATFAPDGPERCSGLPVRRYNPQTLAAELGSEFTLMDAMAERHITPSGGTQSFIYCRFERNQGSPD